MESDDIEEPTMDTDASRVWRDVRWKDTPFERSGFTPGETHEVAQDRRYC